VAGRYCEVTIGYNPKVRAGLRPVPWPAPPHRLFPADVLVSPRAGAPRADEGLGRARLRRSEKDAKLAQKLGQLQLFISVFRQEWMA
jgi:hypothetical protein